MRNSVAINAKGMKRNVTLLIVVAVTGAVVMLALGGATSKSAVAACNTNAKTVESAVAMFGVEHSGLTPTPSLLTSRANGGPTLKSWPNGGARYAITLNRAGEVMVAVPAKSTAVSYDRANPCGAAA
jgi:hypothetical protein